MGVPTWKEKASRADFTAAATLTVLYGPDSAEQFDDMAYVELLNDDGSQTLNAYVELATAAAGPWKDTGFEGFAGIAPGGSAHAKFDVRAYPFWRVSGVASGAGLDGRITVRVLRRPH